MKNTKFIAITDSLLLSLGMLIVALVLFIRASDEPQGDLQLYKQTIKEKYQVFAPPLPDAMTFCGENVPLESAFVRESLDRELTAIMYQHSQTFMILKKTTRYFPQIEPILKANGVPSDLKYLCVAESALSNVSSPAKAEGFWQFIASTAKKYGLDVSDEYDQRYDLDKATEAATKYLKALRQQFQSWTLACAAYNCGESGLAKRLSEQSINDYWNLSLNTETSRYIFRILAYKLLIENPQQFGYYIRLTDCYYPMPTTQIQIDTSVSDFNPICKQLNVTYKMFRQFNPQLRQNKLTNRDKKTYTFLIPNSKEVLWRSLLPHNVKRNNFLK
ncbi:MAG: lytic transglycosylase domain-containing protein [Bacteroidales bacterium]|jgi:soluble lytic murein transglycosylase-like protein|nr:lytic transglycosylase domain-containing protein [Bacteroidales bacterium]